MKQALALLVFLVGCASSQAKPSPGESPESIETAEMPAKLEEPIPTVRKVASTTRFPRRSLAYSIDDGRPAAIETSDQRLAPVLKQARDLDVQQQDLLRGLDVIRERIYNTSADREWQNAPQTF